MPNRGGINRRTGKTTRRNKVKTHWKAKAPLGRSLKADKNGAAAASSPAK